MRFTAKILGAFAFLLFAIGARAQSSFTIPVQNTSGAAISGATVTLTCTDATGGCAGQGPYSATSSNGNAVFTSIPAGNYTVTTSGAGITTYSYAYTVAAQPNGGTERPSSLNGIIFVDGLTYAKTAAGINLAINALPTDSSGRHCGTIDFGGGLFAITAAILKPRCVFFEGHGAYISYTGSGQAIIIGDTISSANQDFYRPGGIRGLHIFGSSKVNGSIGIYCGGDPAGTIDSSSNQCLLQTFDTVLVDGFQYGYEYGNNAYLNTWLGGNVQANGTGIIFPSTINSNSGENSSIIGTQINNNSGCGIQSDAFAMEVAMEGGALDYNGNGTGPGICGLVGNFSLTDVHLEQTSGYLLDLGESSSQNWFMTVRGGEFALTGTMGTTTAFVKMAGTGLNSTYYERDVRKSIGTGQTVTDWVNNAISGGGRYYVNNSLTVAGTMPADHATREGFESGNLVLRDLSCADCWWFSLPPLGASTPNITVFGGANLGSNPTFTVAGTVVGSVGSGNPSFYSPSGGIVSWNADTGLSRDAAGVIDVGNAALGNKTGTLKATYLLTVPQAFASLPSCVSGLEGQRASVNNSTTATYGATITGGGANHVPAYCNGTNWVVD
jgi:hypothetical protein